MSKRLLLLVILMLSVGIWVNAQEIVPIPAPAEDADIAITFPPPVYVIRDFVTIRGTADVIDMESYNVQYRPFPNADETRADDLRPWFPATLLRNEAVRNGSLGVWNTTTARDGIYELRLVVNLTDGTQQIFRVSPIRVLNDASGDFVALPTIVAPSETPVVSGRPTLVPTPTQFGNAPNINPRQPTATGFATGSPIVTALVDANVRQGDSTRYPAIGALFEGEQASVLGISTTGSGWYYIQLANGRQGFVAPSIVRADGDLSRISRIQPPPVPTPPATATPITNANLLIDGIRLEPATPRCGEDFQVFVNVTNNGTGRSNSGGMLTAIDRHVASGTSTRTGQNTFPQLDPRENWVVVITLNSNVYYNEEHVVILQLDSNNQVVETNEGDNIRRVRYTLEQANCG